MNRAMVIALRRNATHFRSATRLFSSFTSSSCSSSLPTSSSSIAQLLHQQSVRPVGSGFKYLGICEKYLFSSAAATGDQEKGSPKANSEEGQRSESLKANAEEGPKSGGSQEGAGNAGKPIRGGPISWLSFLLLVATGAGVLFYYDKLKKRHIEDINNASKAVKEGPSVGKPAIGGPFSLVNQDGKRVTEKDFLGKWNLIYFGFTHCPDICPDELLKLAAAIDKIKETAGIEVVPVFISVDPERDTVEQVREYVKEFHPKLIGLTGNPNEIKEVARAYRVYYMKTSEDDDYLVDHSIVMYLMDPNMEFVKYFGKNNDVNSLVDGVVKEIKKSKK